MLEVMGLIRTATGSGPQSGAIVIAAPGGGLSALLRLQVAAQGFPIADVVGTRLILEQAVVAALAVGGARHGAAPTGSWTPWMPTSRPRTSSLSTRSCTSPWPRRAATPSSPP